MVLVLLIVSNNSFASEQKVLFCSDNYKYGRADRQELLCKIDCDVPCGLNSDNAWRARGVPRADLKFVNKFGAITLTLAVDCNDVQIAKILLEKRATAGFERATANANKIGN